MVLLPVVEAAAGIVVIINTKIIASVKIVAAVIRWMSCSKDIFLLLFCVFILCVFEDGNKRQKTSSIRPVRKKDSQPVSYLQKFYDKISSALTRVQKIGNYQLNEIEISLVMSSGILVLTLEGGITLRYSIIPK